LLHLHFIDIVIIKIYFYPSYKLIDNQDFKNEI